MFNAKYLLYIFNFGLNWCSGEFLFWHRHNIPKIVVKYSTQTVRAQIVFYSDCSKYYEIDESFLILHHILLTCM